ncbi:MAG: hypothetical protein ACI856_002681 [Kiritimatiellia bacterium]|jgi:hypothetical protein
MPSVHCFYGTVKNFTEGRKGHEGKNPPLRSALRRAPPAAVVEPLRSSRPSVNGFRI